MDFPKVMIFAGLLELERPLSRIILLNDPKLVQRNQRPQTRVCNIKAVMQERFLGGGCIHSMMLPPWIRMHLSN